MRIRFASLSPRSIYPYSARTPVVVALLLLTWSLPTLVAVQADAVQESDPSAGIGLDPSQMIEVIMAKDTNGDGFLSLEESDARIEGVFAENDTNNDGRLSIDEVTNMVNRTLESILGSAPESGGSGTVSEPGTSAPPASGAAPVTPPPAVTSPGQSPVPQTIGNAGTPGTTPAAGREGITLTTNLDAEKLIRRIRAMDLNGDNVVTANELLNRRTLLNKGDTNGDGELSFEEVDALINRVVNDTTRSATTPPAAANPGPVAPGTSQAGSSTRSPSRRNLTNNPWSGDVVTEIPVFDPPPANTIATPPIVSPPVAGPSSNVPAAGGGDSAANANAESPRMTKADFMKLIPVINAIDTDGNGVVSRDELLNAGSNLSSLDGDGDGSLTFEELLSGELFPPSIFEADGGNQDKR